MADKQIRVNIPNVGAVYFPASMPLPEIERESAKLSAQARGLEPMALMPSHEPPGVPLSQRATATGMRVAPAIAGAIIGGAGGPFAPITVPLGAAIGSGLGEYAGELYEMQTGQRGAINPTQVAVQTGLGAIPIGRIPGAGATEQLLRSAATITPRRAIQGAGLGAGSAVATQLAETGELPDLTTAGTAAVVGGTIGAAGGRFERGQLRSLAAGQAPGEIVGRYAAQADRPALPPAAGYTVTPDGRIVLAGSDSPPIVNDPPFIRGEQPSRPSVRAQAYRDDAGRIVYTGEARPVEPRRWARYMNIHGWGACASSRSVRVMRYLLSVTYPAADADAFRCVPMNCYRCGRHGEHFHQARDSSRHPKVGSLRLARTSRWRAPLMCLEAASFLQPSWITTPAGGRSIHPILPRHRLLALSVASFPLGRAFGSMREGTLPPQSGPPNSSVVQVSAVSLKRRLNLAGDSCQRPSSNERLIRPCRPVSPCAHGSIRPIRQPSMRHS